MNEYELLQLLEECGYETSDENLDILKEDVNLVEELLTESKKLKRIHKEIADGGNEEEILKREGVSKERYDAYKQGREISRDMAASGHAYNEVKMQRRVAEAQGKRQDSFEPDEDLDKEDTGAHKTEGRMGQPNNKKGVRRGDAGEQDRSTGNKGLDGDGAQPTARAASKMGKKYSKQQSVLAESLDYKLLKILDEEGYEPSDENLAIFKEEILDELLIDKAANAIQDHQNQKVDRMQQKAQNVGKALATPASVVKGAVSNVTGK